jgi:hypothetical protein
MQSEEFEPWASRPSASWAPARWEPASPRSPPPPARRPARRRRPRPRREGHRRHRQAPGHRDVEKAKMTDEADRPRGASKPVEGCPRLADVRPHHRGRHRGRDPQEAHLHRLDAICRADTILATNTSSIPITRIAAVDRSRPDAGHRHALHEPRAGHEARRDHPRPRHQRCHLCHGHAHLAQRMGKTTVVSRDMPGFIVNRVLMPMINEAVYASTRASAAPKTSTPA